MLYAVALENLVVPTRLADGLTREVALRTALLLHKAKDRPRGFERVRKLYGIRSQIVHNGYPDVTMADLNEMRWYAKQAVMVVLTAAEFSRIKDNEGFEQRMTDALLAGPKRTHRH